VSVNTLILPGGRYSVYPVGKEKQVIAATQVVLTHDHSGKIITFFKNGKVVGTYHYCMLMESPKCL
jgi:hypothetical protein